MMERRPWTLRDSQRRLPGRFRDVLPQPPPPALPTLHTSGPIYGQDESTAEPHAASPGVAAGIRDLCHRANQFFVTQRNKFGLFRRYTSNSPPSHDPDGNIAPDHLVDTPEPVVQPQHVHPPKNPFFPYPNHSAFQLGDWYWNGGGQKSQASFRDLVDIVGHPEFSPFDIQRVQWDHVDKLLADDEEWKDDDAGWTTTPVTIDVPFQCRRNTPAAPDAGPREFVVADFHHRSLVSIIREKLSNPTDAEGFHYEPYDLKWQPQASSEPIGVHGELYTSPAFLDAHRELQDLPAEPNCDLPRVVLALMFWSDATLLTSFGETKLWPLYMYFGNESKYRHCKPSENLCNHVAYFQTVRWFTQCTLL